MMPMSFHLIKHVPSQMFFEATAGAQGMPQKTSVKAHVLSDGSSLASFILRGRHPFVFRCACF
jgi:hypothetical protein